MEYSAFCAAFAGNKDSRHGSGDNEAVLLYCKTIPAKLKRDNIWLLGNFI